MRYLVCSFVVLLTTGTILPQQLGININLAERGGTFIDAVKENYRWSNAGEGGELTASDVDAHGWPAVDARYVLDFRPVAEWSGAIDDPEAYRIDMSGTYKCSFSGSGDVRGVTGGSVENLSYDNVTNTTTFDFVVSGPPAENHGFILIDFTATKRTPESAEGSGFTDFRMHRPGYDLTSNKIFTDAFLSALTGIRFTTIRFMNFSMTNGCDPDFPAEMEWDNRKKMNDASQSGIGPLGKTDGGAWEYVIELCNKVKMDPWINIPVSASEGYIRNLALLFKEELASSLNIYVESSNEVWNTAPGFEQSSYSKAQAKALEIGEHENHARRTVEIAEIFGEVFGETALNNTIRVVLCSHQPMLKWWVIPMLDYVSEQFGAPENYIYAIASQTYYSGGSEENVETILQQCRASITEQVDEEGEINEAGRKQWVNVAKAYHLKGGYCSYEGGPDHGGGSTTNIAYRIRAERDERMGEIWTYNLDSAFFRIGANLAMQFTLSSAYTRYGCWGLTDDINNPLRNSKYPAAKNLADKYAASVQPQQKSLKQKRSFHMLKTLTTPKGISLYYRLHETSPAIASISNLKGQRLFSLKIPAEKSIAGEHTFSLPLSISDMNRLQGNSFIVTLETGHSTISSKTALIK